MKPQDTNSVFCLQPSWRQAVLLGISVLCMAGRFSSPWEHPGPLQWRGLSLPTPWGLVFKHPGTCCNSEGFTLIIHLNICATCLLVILPQWCSSSSIAFTCISQNSSPGKRLRHFVSLELSWHTSMQPVFSCSWTPLTAVGLADGAKRALLLYTMPFCLPILFYLIGAIKHGIKNVSLFLKTGKSNILKIAAKPTVNCLPSSGVRLTDDLWRIYLLGSVKLTWENWQY